jgi:hypothetical protein
MNSAALDVKDMLDDASGGAAVGTFGTDLFVSREPASPDAVVTVYDTGGFPPDPNAGIGLQYPTVQVRVRGVKGGYTAASVKARAVHDALHGVTEASWNGSRYLWVFGQQDPMFLGYDESDRPLFAQNFRLARVATV